MARYIYVCSQCGSENVKCDAWAVWNVETQSWEVADTFDAGWCDDCDCEATLSVAEVQKESLDA